MLVLTASTGHVTGKITCVCSLSIWARVRILDKVTVEVFISSEVSWQLTWRVILRERGLEVGLFFPGET